MTFLECSCGGGMARAGLGPGWSTRQPKLARNERRDMILRCHACNADPDGRWKSSAATTFYDPCRKDGNDRDVFVYACRDHLSAKREEEIQRQEKDHWKKGELR
jgi:hypothetical protein